MKKTSMSKMLRILPGLLAVVCCATALAAAPSPEGEGSDAASAGVGASGMKIVVDPTTGEIISIQTGESRALSASLAHALSRSTEGLEVFDLPTGGKGAHLEGRFQHVMTVKVKADGSLELGCVDSASKAKDVLHPKAGGDDDDSRDR